MDFKQEILEKYHMLTLDGYKSLFGDSLETEKEFYMTFLIQTDHIPNKIIEAQILGEEVDDYTDILMLRKAARNNINQISVMEVN